MRHTQGDEEAEAGAVAEVLARRGVDAAAGRAAPELAREWVEHGFDDAEEVEAWLDAGCPDAAAALRLEEAGITPEQAALRTSAGASGTEETLGAKLSRGDLSLEEARRIITRQFWND